jgi:MATE family multidrug resistance protein
LARSALILALVIASINAPLLFFGREFIAKLYTQDPTIITMAKQLFVLAAIFQIVDVIQVIMNNVLRGFQDTKIPMLIIVFSFWAITLPLGFILTFTHWLSTPMGAAGFWTALIVGLSCAALLLTQRMLYFKVLVIHESHTHIAPQQATL